MTMYHLWPTEAKILQEASIDSTKLPDRPFYQYQGTLDKIRSRAADLQHTVNLMYEASWANRVCYHTGTSEIGRIDKLRADLFSLAENLRLNVARPGSDPVLYKGNYTSVKLKFQ